MRYVGSKRRIANHILPIILEHRKPGQYYVEPFVGGFNTMDKVDGPRIANDRNEYLIALFQEVVNGWIPPENVTREKYHDVKSNMDKKYPDYFVGFVGFGCSFGGGFFGGYASPYHRSGRTKAENHCLQSRNAVLKQAKKLEGVEFHSGSYLDLEIPDKSIIYCDPPYEGTKSYKDKLDHRVFWQWVREKNAEGHQIFVSEYQAPKDFLCVWSKSLRVEVASAKDRKNKIEKLFTLF